MVAANLQPSSRGSIFLGILNMLFPVIFIKLHKFCMFKKIMGRFQVKGRGWLLTSTSESSGSWFPEAGRGESSGTGGGNGFKQTLHIFSTAMGEVAEGYVHMQVDLCDWCMNSGNIGKMKEFLSESFYFLCKVRGEIIVDYEGLREIGGHQKFDETWKVLRWLWWIAEKVFRGTESGLQEVFLAFFSLAIINLWWNQSDLWWNSLTPCSAALGKSQMGSSFT